MTTTNTINSTTNTTTTCGGWQSLTSAITDLNACINSNIIQNTNATIDPGICNTQWASNTYTIQPSQFVTTNIITKDNLEEEVEKHFQSVWSHN